jgi:hypothetical protein
MMFGFQNSEVDKFVFLTSRKSISTPQHINPEVPMKSQATLTTPKAERYIAQLCKHFQHKVPANYDGPTGWIELPMGRADLRAEPETLTLSLTAQTAETLEKTRAVIQSHLERFAFREDLDFAWQSQPDA